MSAHQGYEDTQPHSSSTAAAYNHGLCSTMDHQDRDQRMSAGYYGPTQGLAQFSYDPNTPSFLPSGSALFGGDQLIGMECLSCEPSIGWIGTPITVTLRFRQPIPFHRIRPWALALDSKSEGRLEPSGVDAQQCQYYLLRAVAPNIERSPTDGAISVPLSVHLEYFSGHAVSYAEAGLFRYDPTIAAASNAGPEKDSSRKRRMSNDSTVAQIPVKKTSSQQLQQLKSEGHSRGVSTAVPSGLDQETLPSPSALARPRSQVLSLKEYGPRVGAHQPASLDVQNNSVGPHGDVASHASPLSSGPGLSPANPSQASRSAEHLQGLWEGNQKEAGGPRSFPLLVRTSTVPSAASRKVDADPSSADSFNQSMSFEENKAFLDIHGDLDSMAQDWTVEEKRARRRLVEFERDQDGNHVSTSFRPVTLEERAPNSICVSCIWWEEEQEAFVTSVDTIQLLESLVAVRFTVEEKNRIRRNLEGFHPKTVAKGKPESEKFFKTIMDFPNPKPRNIEKDVKVFPWRVLKHALKKIVGKYSTSYAPTQPRIPQPVPTPQSGSMPAYGQYPITVSQTRAVPTAARSAPPGPSQYAAPNVSSTGRPGMESAPQSYPGYPLPAAGMPHHQMQYPVLVYPPGQQHAPVGYGVPSPGMAPDGSWGYGRWEAQVPLARDPMVQYPDLRGWHYGSYSEPGAEAARPGAYTQPMGAMISQAGRSTSYSTSGPWTVPDPRYHYPPSTENQSSR